MFKGLLTIVDLHNLWFWRCKTH